MTGEHQKDFKREERYSWSTYALIDSFMISDVIILPKYLKISPTNFQKMISQIIEGKVQSKFKNKALPNFNIYVHDQQSAVEVQE